MKVSRTSRLNGEYQKEISEIIRLNKDRMFGVKGLISITEVDVAPDLKTAIVYVSIYGVGEEETKTSFAALQEQAGFIRHQLSQVMRMRTVPALTFRMDGSMVYGAKMDALFKSITYSAPADENSEDEE
ncbi:MAG: 30S ribosome-binding factor RbfA [Clostridia bacterium]|nr:30S ribosome-binding factor RbfA [Clostridia bacterium]